MEHSLSLPADAPRMAPLGRLPLFAVVQLTLMGGLAWYWLASARAEHGLRAGRDRRRAAQNDGR